MPETLTKEGYDKLKKELDYLRNIKQREVAEAINKAAAFGDLSENAAYHQAKEDLAFMRGRTHELENILKSAKVICEKTGMSCLFVDIGSTVVVKAENRPASAKATAGEKKIVLRIVAPSEADFLAGKISHESPLGKALLHLKKDEIAEIDSPQGKIKYKVLEIK